MNFLDKLARWLLYIIVAATPVFFLPWSNYPLSLSKQTFFVAVVFLALVLWIINCFVKKELIYKKTPLNWIVLALIVFVGISAWFSPARVIGFWGLTGSEADVFINLLAFGVLYFLISSTSTGSVTKISSSTTTTKTLFPERSRGVTIVLVISAALVLVFSLMQIFGLWVLPWEFAQGRSFNPIGTSNALAIFLGAVFVTLVGWLNQKPAIGNHKKNKSLRSLGKLEMTLMLFFSAVLFIVCFLLGYWPVFLGWVVAMTYMYYREYQGSASTHSVRSANKLSIIPERSRGITLVVLVFSLLILFFYSGLVAIKLPVFNLAPEAMPNLEASWSVARGTLNEGIKNLVIGSGPATFQYQYGLYKDVALNQTDFWNVNFSQGANALMTHLVNWGVLGLLLWLLFAGWVVFMVSSRGPISSWPRRSLKIASPLARNDGKIASPLARNDGKIASPLARNDGGKDSSLALRMTVSAPLLFLLLMLFFYPQNFTLYFLIFVLTGMLVGANAETKIIKEPQKNFLVSLLLTALVVGASGAAYLQVQHYMASTYFKYGVDHADTDYLSLAANLDQYNDVYLRVLANAHLIRANNLLTNKTLTQKELDEQFSVEINSAIGFAQQAVQSNKLNAVNWFNLARIYGGLIPVVADSAQLSFSVYQEAISREPNNPIFYSSLGEAYLAAGDTEKAISNLNKALELKPDYELAQELLSKIPASSY